MLYLKKPYLSVLGVNEQIYSEAVSILYDHNIFRVDLSNIRGNFWGLRSPKRFPQPLFRSTKTQSEDWDEQFAEYFGVEGIIDLSSFQRLRHVELVITLHSIMDSFIRRKFLANFGDHVIEHLCILSGHKVMRGVWQTTKRYFRITTESNGTRAIVHTMAMRDGSYMNSWEEIKNFTQSTNFRLIDPIDFRSDLSHQLKESEKPETRTWAYLNNGRGDSEEDRHVLEGSWDTVVDSPTKDTRDDQGDRQEGKSSWETIQPRDRHLDKFKKVEGKENDSKANKLARKGSRATVRRHGTKTITQVIMKNDVKQPRADDEVAKQQRKEFRRTVPHDEPEASIAHAATDSASQSTVDCEGGEKGSWEVVQHRRRPKKAHHSSKCEDGGT